MRRVPDFSSPLPNDWDTQVRDAMIRRSAPLPTGISTYTRGNERLCVIRIPKEFSLTVEESHARLTRLNKKLAEHLPPVARILVTYDES